LAEWLFEEGIGEDRAVLVDDGEIVEAAIELPGLRAGAVAEARLSSILVPGRRGIATLGSGEEVLVEPLPARLTDGQALRVEILREAIPEPGRPKLAKGRATDEAPRIGPGLAGRIGAFARHSGPGPDLFEQAGWSELLEEAATGEISFPGGALRMSLTPAMTLFDVDGALPPAELAVAGAAATGRAIRRLGIGGSIGIDLPTVAGKAERQASAAALDSVLPQPFERTAVNGFGFLQLVRRRERASLPELLSADPAGAAARALLRRAERAPGAGERILHAAPAVIARLRSEAGWLEALERRLGASVALREEPGLAISAGHVHASPT
jgi:ribonuclease G